MKKIVVATDFSENSKKGILFSMQLAKQMDCELIFYNVIQIYQPTIWDQTYYNVYQDDELQRCQEIMDNFIARMIEDNNIDVFNFKCVCEIGITASDEIISFAIKSRADYIAVSTVGSGKWTQIFGTTASELIAFSTIPVLIIPKNYTVRPITDLFFASDFVNLDDEIHEISFFSNAINANLDIFHFDYQSVIDSNENKFDKFNSKYKSDKLDFHLRNLDSGDPLIKQLEIEITKSEPSLVVVFTKQNRNWFDRLVLSSLSEDLAFDTKTPMLVFKKNLK